MMYFRSVEGCRVDKWVHDTASTTIICRFSLSSINNYCATHSVNELTTPASISWWSSSRLSKDVLGDIEADWRVDVWLIWRAAADLGVKVARSIWEAVEGLRECEGVRGERAAILGRIGLWGFCGMRSRVNWNVDIYIYIIYVYSNADCEMEMRWR